MNKWKVLLVSATLALFTGGVTLAAKAHPANNPSKSSTTTNAKATVHSETGTVNSITNSDMVLEHSYKGKTHDVKFVVNSDTKQDGTIKQGEHVRVYFKHENGQRIATEVKPVPTKS